MEEISANLATMRGGVALPRAVIEPLAIYLVSTLKMNKWTEVEGLSLDGFVDCPYRYSPQRPSPQGPEGEAAEQPQ